MQFKGQKKSKWFFQVDVSSKKQTNEFYCTTMKPQVDLFSFVFLEEIEDTKKTFRNYLTFRGLILDNPQIFLFNFLLGFLSTSGYEEPAWWCFAVLGLCSMPAEPISMRNRAQFTTLLLHFSLYFSWASLPGSPFHINHKHIVHNSRGEGPVLYIVRLYSHP